MHHPTDRITHTTAFVTPVVDHWLEREIPQWVRPMKGSIRYRSHHERTLLPRSYISLPTMKDRSDDPSHHERTLLPRSYSSLPTMKDRSDDPSHQERTLLPRSYSARDPSHHERTLLPGYIMKDPTTHRTMSERSYHGATARSLGHGPRQNV